MIGFPLGVCVWLATGHCDMRKGFPGLALLVQEKRKSELKAEQAARIACEERTAIAESRANGLEAKVETLKPTIAKLRRDKFGASSGARLRLIDQLELQLAELEERIAQDATAAAIAAPPANEQSSTSSREKRRKPARRP